MMKKNSAYKNAIIENINAADQAKSEILHASDAMEKDSFGKEGCQKLSLRMLKEMGIAGVSKMEMNFLLYLAAIQDSDGIAYTNMHMMCTEIGCAASTFMDLLHKLEEKGLISSKRSRSWKECKNGIYYIDLLFNHFSKEYTETPYIRLNHGIFRTKKFYGLIPAAKYIILQGMYSLNSITKNEMKDWVNIPFALELSPLKSQIMEWNSCSKRTVAYGVASIVKNYHGKVESWGKRGAKAKSRVLCLKFTEEELAFRSSDNFSRLSNIIAASCEEEGIHLCKEVPNSQQLAEIVYRNKKQAEASVEEAKKNYQTGLSILNHSFPQNKEEWEKVNALTEDLKSIMKSTNEYHTNFAFLKPNVLTSWGKQSLKGELIKDEKMPLWIRFLIGKLITAYQLIKSSIGNRKWKLKDFDLLPLIEEFIHALISKKEMNTNYITKRLLAYKVS